MSEVEKRKFEGNNYLSCMDLHLWSLVQEVLLRWHTLVVFKCNMWNAPQMVNGLIEFFVPGDCQFRYEIESFLEHELKDEVKEKTLRTKFGDFPGMDVKITSLVAPFNGIPGHVDKNIIDKIVKEAQQRIIMELKKIKNKKKNS